MQTPLVLGVYIILKSRPHPSGTKLDTVDRMRWWTLAAIVSTALGAILPGFTAYGGRVVSSPSAACYRIAACGGSFSRGCDVHMGSAAELEVAQAAARAVAELLPDRPLPEVEGWLASSLAKNGAGAPGRWISFVDDCVVVIALLDKGEAILSLVHVIGDVTVYATLGDGAFVVQCDALQSTSPATSGGSNSKANVLCIPGQWCSAIDKLVTHLQQTGLGMPLQLKPSSGSSVCEGLLDVVVGRADVYLAPPSHYLSQSYPPPQVLCAFDLLLAESGGILSDVFGEPIDLLDAVSID